jgi:hypothetical protein
LESEFWGIGFSTMMTYLLIPTHQIRCYVTSELKVALKRGRVNDITMIQAKAWDLFAKFKILLFPKCLNVGGIAGFTL